ncbi:MAG: NUDIX domain-containing protein [Thaumarchaeota archaeon]|nr:NUDIX domain-containing protein [Nitrososphaerota archaeon]
MRNFQAVSCVLVFDAKILLLKRSDKVRTNKGMWSVVAGEVEGDPYITALKEIEEETGLAEPDIALIRRGDPFNLKMTIHSMTTLHPYLFSTISNTIRLNWEHDEFQWISIDSIDEIQLVPRFSDLLRSVHLIP